MLTSLVAFVVYKTYWAEPVDSEAELSMTEEEIEAVNEDDNLDIHRYELFHYFQGTEQVFLLDTVLGDVYTSVMTSEGKNPVERIQSVRLIGYQKCQMLPRPNVETIDTGRFTLSMAHVTNRQSQLLDTVTGRVWKFTFGQHCKLIETPVASSYYHNLSLNENNYAFIFANEDEESLKPFFTSEESKKNAGYIKPLTLIHNEKYLEAKELIRLTYESVPEGFSSYLQLYSHALSSHKRLDMRDGELALKIANKLLTFNEKAVYPYDLMGQAYAEMGDYENALKYAKKAQGIAFDAFKESRDDESINLYHYLASKIYNYENEFPWRE